jgi:hypothetical protein
MPLISNPQPIDTLVTLETKCPRCGNTFAAQSLAVRSSEVRPTEPLTQRLRSLSRYILLGGALACAVAAAISPHRYLIVRTLVAGSVMSLGAGMVFHLAARFGEWWSLRAE